MPENRDKNQPIAVTAAALPLLGCVTVNAPDKPIEINLNVAISQEVLVRLHWRPKTLREEIVEPA